MIRPSFRSRGIDTVSEPLTEVVYTVPSLEAETGHSLPDLDDRFGDGRAIPLSHFALAWSRAGRVTFAGSLKRRASGNATGLSRMTSANDGLGSMHDNATRAVSSMID